MSGGWPWYRQDASGCWSAKDGPCPASNVDGHEQLISDPRTVARDPYTQFCAYMIVRPSSLNVG